MNRTRDIITPPKQPLDYGLNSKLQIDIPAWSKNFTGLLFEEYNCWQLICLIYFEQFGLQIPTYIDEYDDALDKQNIKKIYERELEVWHKISSPLTGSVIVLRVEGQPWHAGLVISKKDMLHTQIGIDSAIETYNGLIWKNRIVGYYQYR
jgi:hypothetical protein